MEKPKNKKHKEIKEVDGQKPGTPCLVAAAPFFLLSTVLFYYVFTEDYNFKWTLVIIFSGCAVLLPGVVFLMLGMSCIATGWEGKLEQKQDCSHPISSKRKIPEMTISPSLPPDLQWKTVPIQSDE